MDQNSDAAEAAGRPQRERMPTAKMLDLTASADFFSLIDYDQGQTSKASAAADAEDGIPTVKRGRGRPRKDGSITSTNRLNAKVLTPEPQAQIKCMQAQASASLKESPILSDIESETESKVERYLEERRAFYAQVRQRGPYNRDPFVPLPNSNPFRSETPAAQAVWSSAASPAESIADSYFEESRAFYNQLPFSIDPSVPRPNPNPFEPEITDAQTAATEQSQAVSSGSSPESYDSSEEDEAPATPVAFPFSVDLPTSQPSFQFGAVQPSESSSLKFDNSRLYATKRAPTAQNQHLWQRKSSPLLGMHQAMVAAQSNAESLERQESDFQNEELNGTPGFASGSGMSAAGPSQEDKQIEAEQGEPGAESGGSRTLPEIPDIKVDGVRLADVDEFIWHFAGYIGVANPPRDPEKSLDGMVKVLTNWNSVYTIYAAPTAEDSYQMGGQVGLHLAIRLACKGHAGLLKPLAEYFQGLTELAETEIQNLSDADMRDYQEHREISWMYMQLMQRRFAKQARVKIIEIAKIEALKQQEMKEMRRRVDATGGIGIAQAPGGSQNIRFGTSAAADGMKEEQNFQDTSVIMAAAEKGKEDPNVWDAPGTSAAVDKGKGKEEGDGLVEDPPAYDPSKGCQPS